MKVICLVVALGLLCLTQAKPAKKYEMKALESSLRRLTGLLNKKQVAENTDDVPAVMKLYVIEHIFSELMESVDGVEEKMAEIEETVGAALEGLSAEDIIAAIPDIVDQIYTTLVDFLGDKVPTDVSKEDIKLFIKLTVVMHLDLPSVEEMIEKNSEKLIQVIIDAFKNLDWASIVDAESYEAAFSSMLVTINPELEALAAALPAELDPLKDLIAPIVQFHVRVELLKAVIGMHVPGIEEEMNGAIKLAMRMRLAPGRAFMYVVIRVGYYIYIHNPELAQSLQGSLEAEEIIREAFERVMDPSKENGEGGKRPKPMSNEESKESNESNESRPRPAVGAGKRPGQGSGQEKPQVEAMDMKKALGKLVRALKGMEKRRK